MGFGRGAVLVLIVACLGLAAAGCGGSGDSTTVGGATTTSPSETAQSNEGAGGGQKPSPTKNGEKGGSTGGGGSGGQNFNREPTQKEVESYKAPPGGDNSIQTYGSVASGGEEGKVVAAMRSFFHALASSDYKEICGGITASNREGFVKLLKAKHETGGCETVLKGLLLKAAAEEARRAAHGVVYQVRVKEGNAFVLFTPEGGVASYFVMKDENGSWKATGINAGVPFNPTEQPSGAQ